MPVRTVNSKLSIAMHYLIFLYEYGNQTKVTSTLLSLSTGCNPVIIRNIMSALKKAGIITSPKGPGGAKLAMPPEDISLGAVYSAVDHSGASAIFGFHTAPSAHCPVGRNIHAVLEIPYHELENAVQERMKTLSLQSVLDDYHRIPEEAR
jgi:DNA-binding IscR family transcriptional regulator